MKKILLTITGLAAVAVVGVYLFRAPLMEAGKSKITENMFISADTDAFNPGLGIGEKFPLIHARYQGRIASDMGEFIGDKGMVFIANRSVDW